MTTPSVSPVMLACRFIAASSDMTDAVQGINLDVATEEIRPKYCQGWFHEAFQLR